MGLVVILDAGHGLTTPGKRTPDGMLEFEFNNPVALKVAELLKEYGVTHYFVHDKTGEIDVPLHNRTDLANRIVSQHPNDKVIYVSIHANAFGNGGWNDVSGIETFVHTSKPDEAMQLASHVQNQLLRQTGRKNRGVKDADFWVLRKTSMTAILVECEFMTNKEAAYLLKSTAYRELCAKAIVDGIADAFRLQKQVKTDYEGHTHEENIEWVKEKGFMNGYADGTFGPNDQLTRGQLATVLKRFYDKLNLS